MATRNKPLYGKVLFLTYLALMSGLLSCGGNTTSPGSESTGTGTLKVSIQLVPPPYYANHGYGLATGPSNITPRAASYPDNVCSEYGIQYVTLTVEANGTLISKKFICSAHTGEITRIPVGSNYTLTVDAPAGGFGFLDDWVGSANGINVRPGETTLVDKILIYWNGPMTPPGIQYIYPQPGAVNVGTNTIITVGFNKSIVGETIDNNSFLLSGNGVYVVGAVSYDTIHKTATFTPTANLEPNTIYTVELKNTITDFANLRLAPFSGSFLTSGTTDTTPPSVVSTDPVNNAINVSVNANATVWFSERMDSASVTGTGGITMMDNNSVSVPGGVNYNNIDNSAVFDPQVTLNNLSYYSLKVSKSVKDLAGNSLPADFVVLFRTSAASLVSIAVTPTSPSITIGTPQQFTAMGTFSDNTTQDLTTSVTWNSSNTGVATISNGAGNNGKATSLAAGSSTITALSGSVSGSATLTVTGSSVGVWDTSTWGNASWGP